MTDGHESFAELAAGWALGALDGEDAERFARHQAEGCVECQRTLADYREALVRVAGELREPPPPDVRAAVLARVGTRPRRLRLVVGWAASMAVAASLAAVVTERVVGGAYEGRLAALQAEASRLKDELTAQTRTVADLQRALDQREQTLTLVRAESEERARTLALLGDPATRIVSLAGLPPSPGARARILWSGRGGGLLVANDLPPVPEGKTYELWAIAGGKPLPAGLFGVDAGGKGTLRIAPLPGAPAVQVFAVTLEPAEGVPAPTGPMYLASKAA